MVRVDGNDGNTKPIQPKESEPALEAKGKKPITQAPGIDPKSAAAIVAATFLASPLTAAFMTFPKVKKDLDEQNPAAGDRVRDDLYAKVHKIDISGDSGEGPATEVGIG